MVQRPELNNKPGTETVPVTEKAMNPTWADDKKEHAPDEFATFVTLAGAGKSHTIQLKPREEKMVQIGGESGARMVPVQGSGVRIRFVEGAYTTADEWIIDQLLTNPKCGFGTDIDINRRDPTGYWRKSGRFEFVVNQTVTITDSNIGRGPLTQRQAKVA
jgi:hypothetical protein